MDQRRTRKGHPAVLFVFPRRLIDSGIAFAVSWSRSHGPHNLPREPAMKRRGAFTLIELLVVVTIIVVLLALLTPALDKAIYQAQLARCAAQIKGIGAGATAYSTEHR